MKHAIATLTTAALATGVALSTAPAATAVTVARSQVRTYVASQTFDLDGFGDVRGWYYHDSSIFKVVLSPHLAYYSSNIARWLNKGKPETTPDITYLVGTHTYEKQNGARNWTIKTVTPAQLRTWDKAYVPAYGLNSFYSIPGVRLVGPGHYHVTCTVAQVSAFWQDYLGINTKNSLVANGFKTVTVDLWINSIDQPVKITVTGKSRDVRVNLLLTTGHYNQPLTIKAPV